MVDEVTGAAEAENPGNDDDDKTILQGGDDTVEGGEGQQKTIAPDWPDDWRTKLAGDDEKLGKRLARFQSPKDIMKSWLAADQKISSGEYKTDLPKDATEEQLAAYRKERGIPEKPEGYLESLPDGLVIGEDDKEFVQSYVESVHGINADPAVVAKSLAWYQDLKEQEAASMAERDREAATKYEDELRAEWGNEYRANINSVKAFLDSAPPTDDGQPLGEMLLGSRLADGTPIGNHPAVIKWLSRLANDANPAGFVAPGSSGTQAESVADEIAEIQKVMRTDRRAYNKNTKMQERYRSLLDAKAKLAS